MDHADHADLTLASSDPPGRFRPSRRVPVAAAAVLVVLVALAVLGVLVTREGSTPGSVDADSQPASFAPPAAVAADEELVRSRILASGDIRVDHWLSSTRPLTRVVLPPASTGGAAATVDRVRVQTSRGVLQGPSAVGARPRAYALEGAKQVHVSYVLTGAVTRSGPGDRALASPTSLDLDYPGDRVPRIVVLLGGRLLSAACSADPTVAPRPCGQAEGTSWRVRLEPRERGDVVTAQLDLG